MQPYMEAQYVNIAFLLVLNTGAIPDSCRDWQRRTPVNQTWADFRREFAHVQREQHIISSTTRGAGFQTENVAEHYAPTPLCTNSGFVTAMVNLSTATSAYHETVETFTKAIATLTEQLKAKDIWARSQEDEIKRVVGAQDNATPISSAGPTNAYVRKSYKTKK
jgi:hypothetical protein